MNKGDAHFLSPAGTVKLIDGLHFFHPPYLHVHKDRFPLPSLSDPIDFQVMENFRATIDHEMQVERSVTLSAVAPAAGFARMDPADYLLWCDDGNPPYAAGVDPIYLTKTVKGGSDIRFEFSALGRYVADICIECLDDTVVRLTELRRSNIARLGGFMKFREDYWPCGDRLTFLFDVSSQTYFLSLEMFSNAAHTCFRWAKFTRISDLPPQKH
jgi:hypothetical protein